MFKLRLVPRLLVIPVVAIGLVILLFLGASTALSGGTPIINTDGYCFPVGGKYSYCDTWLAPRDGGRRKHYGCDVFAKRGTYLYAIYDGVISKKYSGGLGGLSLWINTDDGKRYFYTHLNGFAPGIEKGVEVKAGQVVGYMGNSGNARTTPCHLHLGIKVNGTWVNPYPVLKQIENAQTKKEAG